MMYSWLSPQVETKKDSKAHKVDVYWHRMS